MVSKNKDKDMWVNKLHGLDWEDNVRYITNKNWWYGFWTAVPVAIIGTVLTMMTVATLLGYD